MLIKPDIVIAIFRHISKEVMLDHVVCADDRKIRNQIKVPNVVVYNANLRGVNKYKVFLS